MNLIDQEMSARLNFRTRNKTLKNPIFDPLIFTAPHPSINNEKFN